MKKYRVKGLENHVRNYAGKEIRNPRGEPFLVKDVIAQSLDFSNSPEKARAHSLAIDIYRAGDSIDLKVDDYSFIKDVVKNDRSVGNVFGAACLEVLEDAEKIGKK